MRRRTSPSKVKLCNTEPKPQVLVLRSPHKSTKRSKRRQSRPHNQMSSLQHQRKKPNPEKRKKRSTTKRTSQLRKSWHRKSLRRKQSTQNQRKRNKSIKSKKKTSNQTVNWLPFNTHSSAKSMKSVSFRSILTDRCTKMRK